MPKVPTKKDFMQTAVVIGIGLVGVWAYSYYTQTHDTPTKAKTSERANSDPITKPVIQHAQTPDKMISAFEQSMNNPSKNAINRTY
jgi:hypothetical protein